jgi:CheY-like chemotaxis protein/HPt (histidine-containing phosphotransfer) domain-containing protein
MNQQLAVRLLSKHGHAVTVVDTGRQAIDQLAAERFDLVLMDVQMPDMDGLAATAEIRRREAEKGGHIPIIAMTAHALPEDREACLAAGMDAYVSKPIRADELLAVIGSVVEPAATHPDAGQPAPMDWNGALDRVGGDRELLRDVAAMFLRQCPTWLADIRSAVAGADAAALRAAAHPLKGSLGLFGAVAAANAASRLETMARAGKLDDGRATLADLEREMSRVTPALAALAGQTEVTGS